MKTKLILAALIAGLLGCVSNKIKYDSSFESVKTANTVTPAASGVFENATVKIEAAHKQLMVIRITNKSSGKILIHWDESLFVDPLGAPHKIMHEGVRYIARNELQPPTVILPNAVHVDAISNVDNVRLGGSAGWQDLGILQYNFAPIDGAPQPLADQFVNKPMQLLLVIEHAGRKTDYYLNFKVNGYTKL
jgi:hypothetical protein